MKYFLFFMLLSSFAFADSKLEKTIFVTGKCKKNILPDRVSVTITIEELNKNQKISSQIATEKYNELLTKIKNLKLKNSEYETIEYRVFPHKPWENRKQVFKGYKTRIGLKVSTSEMNKAGKLLSAGNQFGSEFVSGPTSFVSDKLLDKTYNDCLEIALLDAKTKGSILAKTSGRKLGKVMAIREGSGVSLEPKPMYHTARMEMSLGAKSAAAAPEIEYGTQKINVSLSVYFDMN